MATTALSSSLGSDVDVDGCDPRQEARIADPLTPVSLGDGCGVYHVVPLKEAWASGAHA